MIQKKLNNILIILSGSFDNPILTVEQYLSLYLSKNKLAICFEFPRFSNLIKIITRKIPLTEAINNNLIVYHSFGILPFGRSVFVIDLINYILNYLVYKHHCKLNYKDKTIITFTPEAYFIKKFISNNPIYYYIVDDYKSLPPWNNIFKRILFNFLDGRIAKIAKKIIVVSSNLYQQYLRQNKNVCLYPTPVELKNYLQNLDNKIPFEIKDIPKPIVGYIGTIRDYNMDTDLLFKVITRYTQVSFVFIGILDKHSNQIKDLLNKLQNCYYLECVSVKNIPDYVYHFDSCIIPYKIDRFGNSSYPVKTMEYLSLGKPVVTTALPTLKYLHGKNLIYWSKNIDEFIKNIDKSLNEKTTISLKNNRIEEAKKNDWSKRINEFIKIIES